MFPSYVAILSTIKETEECTIKQLYGVTDVRGTALRYICHYLVEQGYLEYGSSKNYRITPAGKKALLEARLEMMVGYEIST